MSGQSLYVCLLESCGNLDGIVNALCAAEIVGEMCACVVLSLMSTDKTQNMDLAESGLGINEEIMYALDACRNSQAAFIRWTQ